MPRRKVPQRRQPGEGNIRQRPDGRWEARYTGLDGQRHSIYGTTQDDVGRRLREQNHNRDLGLGEPQSGRLTFSAMLDLWLEDLKRGNRLRPLGWQAYARIVRNHLQPKLGKVRLNRLTHQHLNQLYGDLERQGLHSSTVRAIHGVASTALRWARQENLMVNDPASLTKRLTKGRNHHHGLTAAQVVVMLQHLEGHRDQALFSMALLGGFRFGELAGLRWTDIDLETGEAHVQQALSRITRKTARSLGLTETTIMQDPKTEKSDRFVLLPAEVVGHLKRHRLQQRQEFLAKGREWKEAGLVFLSEPLTPIRNSVINERWHLLQTAVGIPADQHVRFHDTRRTAATLAEGAGHIRDLMARLGHGQESMTRWYQDAGNQQAIVAHIERLLAEERAKTLREAQ